MRKNIFKTILFILLILSILIFSYLFVRNYIVYTKINSLSKEKIIISNINNQILDNKLELEEELNDINEQEKDKVSEYEVWKETNQKIKEIIG